MKVISSDKKKTVIFEDDAKELNKIGKYVIMKKTIFIKFRFAEDTEKYILIDL